MADTGPEQGSGSDGNSPSPGHRGSGSGERSGSSTNQTNVTRTVMGEGYALQSGFANLPRRPNFIPDVTEYNGQIAEITVVGNSFRVEIDEGFNFEVVKYDVIFDPPLQEDALDRERILEKMHPQLHGYIGAHALDNARIYAWKPTDWDDSRAFEFVDNIRVMYEPDHYVELRSGQRNHLLDMDLQYQQQVLSVFLRELCRGCGFIRMGRNHYDPEACDRDVSFGMNSNKLSGILKMMDGFRMSLEYTCTAVGASGQEEVPDLQNTVSLTIDACSRVLDPRNVREVIAELCHQHQNWRALKKALIGELRGRAVITTYNNKIYKINEVIFNTQPSVQMMRDPVDFDNTGEEVSVTNFYKEKYGIDVTDHEFAVLLAHDLSPRKRDKGRTRTLFLVPELCQLTGYPPKIRKNHALMKKLARANKIPSAIRCQKVADCAQRMSDVALVNRSPLKISPELIQIQGRIYADAEIYLRKKGQNNEAKAIDVGQLQASWKREGMFNQVALGDEEWFLVYPKKMSKKAPRLHTAMAKHCLNMGSNILGKPIMVQIDKKSVKNWEAKLEESCQAGPKAIVVVIPCSAQPDTIEKQFADDVYNTVKRLCSKDYGIPSQCIQSANIDTSHVQVGITRQLFTKLGCLPWKLKFCLFGESLNLKVPTMLVGIDVNHDRKESRSPVAFVSTWDRDFVRVHSQLSYHKLADEVLNPEEMRQMMVNACEHFKEKNRVYPKQIILYRDGIASTQIEHVQKNEMEGIRQAFVELKLRERRDVKLEFILVNKRVNSRFVEKDSFSNVPKGLIVDNHVVSSQYWDFYITPADAPEGCTSTPTRFIIIRDDLNLSARKAVIEIEAFTKQLCNLYYNWPGPVRVPHIVKNADKLTTQFGSAVNGSIPHHTLQDTYHFL